VSKKSKDIQDLKNTISQKKKIIQNAQKTIVKRNKTIEDLKKEVSNLKKASNPNKEPLGIPKHQRSLEPQETHSKDDEIRTLENQLAHRDHVVRTLEFAYENLERSSEERIATLWDEIKAKDRELGELRNRFEKERLVWEPDTQHQPASSSSGKIKKEKQLKIKSEPMEY
jgi:chromosome segregation ATPase